MPKLEVRWSNGQHMTQTRQRPAAVGESKVHANQFSLAFQQLGSMMHLTQLRCH